MGGAHFRFNHHGRGNNELTACIANGMDAENLAKLRAAQNLDDASSILMLDQVAPRHGHGDERLLVSDSGGLQLFFRVAHHGHFRMGVNHGGQRVVAHRILHVEHVVDGNNAFAGGGVGQHAPSRHIAAGPDPRNVGFALLGSLDAFCSKVDANLFQTQVFHIRAAHRWS